MSNTPETTQAPATTQAPKQNNNSSTNFETSKAHIYINKKTENKTIKREMIYNIDITIDITQDENLKKLAKIDPKITQEQNANTMINMNPVNKKYPAYIYFDINNDLNTPFSGSFYVSFDTGLFVSEDVIPIGKIEVDKNKFRNSKDITFYLTKLDNKYYINVEDSNDTFEIKDFFSNESKVLSFLVLYKYNENILNVGFNEKDDVFTIVTGGIVIKSLMFGNKLSDDVKTFNTTIKENSKYNCFIGGIRFYNELNSFTKLRNSAYFKAPPTSTKESTGENTPSSIKQSESTQAETIITQSEVQSLEIHQALIESFTNYSPSAELFKNI